MSLPAVLREVLPDGHSDSILHRNSRGSTQGFQFPVKLFRNAGDDRLDLFESRLSGSLAHDVLISLPAV